jgi:hypothetical protein
MPGTRKRAAAGRLSIEAELLDVRDHEKPPHLVAYVFGQSGKLLTRHDLKAGKGDVPLPDLKEPETLRVAVGPPIESTEGGDVLSALDRLDAPTAHVRSDQVDEPFRVAVDRPVWNCWLRFCTVRGTLLKRILTGGLSVDLPVCGAEVEIYEVDPVPVIFPKIPDYILDRIREIVLKPWPPPPPEDGFRGGGLPFPPAPPGPGPDPVPFLGGMGGRGARTPSAGEMRAIGIAPVRQELLAVMADIGAEADLDRVEGEGETRDFQFTSGEETVVSAEEAAGSLRALADVPEVRTAAASGLSAFRSALGARPELVRPLLCWLWPPAVTYQLVATATTDECGKFRASVYVGCSSDQPDLYFRAYRRIAFFRIPIYDPTPIACHTWWDYPCGTEVTLVTTNPFAQTCPPCKPVVAPDHWVLAMAVGNTSLAAIHGTGPNISATPLGQTGPNSGWGDGSPFGGDLRLRFEFDNTLRTDLNVRYYRVRWRKAGSGNPWMDLTDTVWRHYAHWVSSTLMIEPYKLGPQAVGGTPNLYEMPPALPPVGQWIIADAVVDTTSALFHSASLAPANGGEGLYEFELTLFDAGGAAVNANSLGIVYVVPKTVDLTTTIQTQNASALGLVTGSGRLIYQLHVDNNPCDGALDAPTLGGSAASDDCGLLRYSAGTDGMALSYLAKHPNGFATYEFDVYRGTTHLDAVSEPSLPGTLPVGSAPWTHTVSTTAGDLLDTCTIAGFAETLAVYALATDGWSRQWQYNAWRIRAFALAPLGA